MTTFILKGSQISYNPFTGTNTGLKQVELRAYGDTGFSYSVLNTQDGAYQISLNSAASLRLSGYKAADIALHGHLDFHIANMFWQEGATTVLLIDYHIGSEAGNAYFILDGPQFPHLDSLADAEEFFSGAVFGPPDSPYGPGQQIPWTDFTGSGVTEEDSFSGTAGDDVFDGGAGRDHFSSSAGDDTYIGGRGKDYISFAIDPGSISVNLRTGTATDGHGGTDSLSSIEEATGSNGADSIIGSKSDNVFRGLGGDDTISGGRGHDAVRYDFDHIYGGTGGVTADLRKGTATDGYGDSDTLIRIEDVYGTSERDRLFGDKGVNALVGLQGNDVLSGRGGNDLLVGLSGRDKLNGGTGNDNLTGGTDADIFIFANGFGNDTIGDFEAENNREKIDLSGVDSIKGMRDLRNNHMEQNGDDVVIDDAHGNTITLTDVSLFDLGVKDFIF